MASPLLVVRGGAWHVVVCDQASAWVQGQKWFMEQDKDMYFEDEDVLTITDGAEGAFPMRVRSMDLNDELGQVSHIFSDKTGATQQWLLLPAGGSATAAADICAPICAIAGHVLTSYVCVCCAGTFTLNYMELRKVSVGSISYGLGTTQIGLAGLRRKKAPLAVIQLREEQNRLAAEQPKVVPHVNFLDGSDTHPILNVHSHINTPEFPQGPHHKELHHFLLHLVLNHTVVPEERTDAHGNKRKTLSASSPDEEAFVYTGQYFGYEFLGDKAGVRTIRITKKGVPGHKDVQFRVLEILSYDNARKCMSVIVQHPDDRIYLYLKGADSAVFSRLAPFDRSLDGMAALARKYEANNVRCSAGLHPKKGGGGGGGVCVWLACPWFGFAASCACARPDNRG